MRAFLFHNREITRCGAGEYLPNEGIVCMCPTCGTVWGKVQGMGHWGSWLAYSAPCEKHSDAHRVGGSFLTPLIWWDHRNGQSLQSQLDSADFPLLVHEALMHANFILRKENHA